MIHSHRTAIVMLSVVIVSADNLRENRSAPLTKQSGTGHVLEILAAHGWKTAGLAEGRQWGGNGAGRAQAAPEGRGHTAHRSPVSRLWGRDEVSPFPPWPTALPGAFKLRGALSPDLGISELLGKMPQTHSRLTLSFTASDTGDATAWPRTRGPPATAGDSSKTKKQAGSCREAGAVQMQPYVRVG